MGSRLGAGDSADVLGNGPSFARVSTNCGVFSSLSPIRRSSSSPLALITLWLAVQILRREFTSRWGYFALVVLTPVMLISHITFGAFALISVLSPGDLRTGRRQVPPLQGPVECEFRNIPAAALAVFFIGAHDLEVFVLSKALEQAAHILLSSQEVSCRFWGRPCSGFRSHSMPPTKERTVFSSPVFWSWFCCWRVGVIFSVPTGERFLIFAAFFLQLALIWAILEGEASPPRPSRSSTKPEILIRKGFILSWLFSSDGISRWRSLSSRASPSNFFIKCRIIILDAAKSHRMVSDLRRLAPFIPERAVVMAPDKISRLLPAFSGKVVVALSRGLFHVFRRKEPPLCG